MNQQNTYHLTFFTYCLLFIAWVNADFFAWSQATPVLTDSIVVIPTDTLPVVQQDSINEVKTTTQMDSIPIDSIRHHLVAAQDSILVDSLGVAISDSIPTIDSLSLTSMRFSKDSLDAPINAKATDSIVYDIAGKKIYLYSQAQVEQNQMKLTAAEMVISQEDKTITALHRKDSLDNVVGKPIFSEGDQSFESDEMTYNFKTKKGIVREFVYEDGGNDGYLRAEKVKKNEFDEFFVKRAFYTTCNLDHPHFKIQTKKGKVIPNKLVISGPAQLVIEDIPTPLYLPFGIFPLYDEQSSGIILPTYGLSPGDGYFLQGMGFYLDLGEHMDLGVRGDIYTGGRFRINATSAYNRRYKYRGSVNISYGRTPRGDRDAFNFGVGNEFSVTWQHSQDGKARPNSNFSANVNFRSSSFNAEFEAFNRDVLSNNINSSVTYSNNLVGTPFTMSVSATHNQNINTGVINLNFPNLVLNLPRQFLFKRKKKLGKEKWYERIAFTYSTNANAQVSGVDSTFFQRQTLEDIRYGVRHTPRFNFDFKLFKFINVVPQFTYNSAWHLKTIERSFDPTLIFLDEDNNEIDPETGEVADTTFGTINTFNNFGFKSVRDFNTGLTLTTKLFGLLQFKKGKLKAIRHEMTPQLTFTYRPDFSTDFWGYYRDVVNTITGDTLRYSIFEGSLYPGSIPMGKNASLRFSLGNNFQAKVRTDSTDRKVRILDQLSFGTSYNFRAINQKLAPLTFSGSTTILNKLNLSFGGNFDTYALDSMGRRANDFLWDTEGRLLRLNTFNFRLQTGLNSDFFAQKREAKLKQTGKKGSKKQTTSDFAIPWRIGLNYIFGLNRTKQEGQKRNIFMQTINANVNLDLTDKWAVNINSGYDVTNKAFSRTEITITRDLHCWLMRFYLAPFGAFRRYEFTINVRASILQDLKLNRQRRWQDF